MLRLIRSHRSLCASLLDSRIVRSWPCEKSESRRIAHSAARQLSPLDRTSKLKIVGPIRDCVWTLEAPFPPDHYLPANLEPRGQVAKLERGWRTTAKAPYAACSFLPIIVRGIQTAASLELRRSFPWIQRLGNVCRLVRPAVRWCCSGGVER